MLAIVQMARANPAATCPASRRPTTEPPRVVARGEIPGRAAPGATPRLLPGWCRGCPGCGFAGVLTDGRLRGTAGSGLALLPG